jgi:hypothetical protein
LTSKWHVVDYCQMKTKYYVKCYNTDRFKELVEYCNKHDSGSFVGVYECADSVPRLMLRVSASMVVKLVSSCAIQFTVFKSNGSGITKFTPADYTSLAVSPVFNSPSARKHLIYRVYLMNDLHDLIGDLRDYGRSVMKMMSCNLEQLPAR